MADRSRDESDSYRFLLALGLDSDGHSRLTQSEEYLLLGGSEETHERMQEEVERFRETLGQMGTDLQHASDEEVQEAARESGLGRTRRPRRRRR